MFKYPDALWLNASPSLLRFDLPAIHYLSGHLAIAQWEYRQHQDEASSLDIALNLLNDYLQTIPQPIHLIGHSTGGLLGLMYARKYPEKVKSLTTLGLGVNPAVDWPSYYYILREALPCSRQLILSRLAKNLFGSQRDSYHKAFIEILAKALDSSLSPHSLYQRVSLPTGGISQPLMICGSQDDRIITHQQLRGWKMYFKEGDRLWECPQGFHFFHYFHPQAVGQQVLKFWHSLAQKQSQSTLSCAKNKSLSGKM
jgi:pimeloyl-ACP methyl ester carboxylesterase